MAVVWTAEDIRIAALLEEGVGPIRVISHEENRMTDGTESFAGPDPADDGGWGEATGKPLPQATYPEYPYSLADHVYTWSPKLPDNSMLVIRAQSADGLMEAVEAVAPLVGRLSAAWRAAIGQPQAPAPAPQGQFSLQGGVNYNPQTPPPNQPFQGQPAWQQAGAPQAQAPQWAPPAQQGAQVPQGWYKLTVPFPQKGAFDAIVAQYNFTKGDPGRGGQVSWQKAVKSWYCSPDVAQAFAQFNPMAA